MLVAQLCPTLCNPLDCSLPGSSVHGIFQTRILEGLPIPFSMDQTPISHTVVRFFTISATRESPNGDQEYYQISYSAQATCDKELLLLSSHSVVSDSIQL